jgi:hypothetical protein
LEAFRVDLFLKQDTPENATGSYTIKLVAKVSFLVAKNKNKYFENSIFLSAKTAN